MLARARMQGYVAGFKDAIHSRRVVWNAGDYHRELKIWGKNQIRRDGLVKELYAAVKEDYIRCKDAWIARQLPTTLKLK